MNLIQEILEEFINTTIPYKGMKTNLLGIPKFKNRSFGVMRSTIYKMQKDGLINKQDDFWNVTKNGKKYLNKKIESLEYFSSSLKENAPKNLIVIFDIPETRKAEREWFRWHLKKFYYKMIQRSVWVGPSPLPEQFMQYIENIKLRKCVKAFKLAKSYK